MTETLTPDKKNLLQALNKSWPTKYRLHFDGDEIGDFSSHILAEEIDSVINDQKCCLPFFIGSQNEIAWFNIARDADDLQSTIQTLRCWFIPSYGWEDDRGWIVTDQSASSELAQNISAMSPAGYCRWRSKQSDFEIIARKLAQIRFLEKAKPELPPNGPPPLIQIRQQFVTALVAGDKPSAEHAIRLVETHQLDSADNSLFMWIRFWFTFREFERISKHKDIYRLTQLRIPKVVKQCITRAFYFTHLDSFDWIQEDKNILASYKLDVHETIGGLIGRSNIDEGVEIVRMLACYAVLKQDAELATQLAANNEVGCLRRHLDEIKTKEVEEIPLEEQFWNARKLKDWELLQGIGLILVDSDPDSYVGLLRQSLSFKANEELEQKLANIAFPPDTTGSETEETQSSRTIPKSWSEWISKISQPEEVDFATFISEKPDVEINQLSPQFIVELGRILEEVYLSTDLQSNQATRQLLLTGLPELMQDFVNESGFPRDTLVPIYSNIFRLWAELKCGSTHPPDSQVLLNLADGILTYQRDIEFELVSQFDSWWKKSPVKALLPFLLGVVDLLHTKGTEEQCSNFWIAGAEYLKNNPKYLTVGERSLWRQIGLQLFDQATIDEYLPIPEDIAEVDPLEVAKLKKVAIVSMREPQAKSAAEMIRERSGSDVVLVTRKAAGAQTDNALTADVVLFVWKATSHSVFRAFDKMDKVKLAYVQGTGAGSIILALERWIVESSNCS